jgi:membrane protease YdiL (CAAX protease family)
MSFVTAAIWSVCAIVGLDFLLLLTISVGSSAPDIVTGVLCEAAAFVSTLFLLTLVHEGDRPLSEVVALRRPPIVLLLLAALLGVSLQGPVNLIAGVIYDRFPLPNERIELLRQIFDVHDLPHKVAIVAAAGVVGPLVEELLFRGGIFRGVLSRNGPVRTVFGIAVFFALAHREPRDFLPDFIGGLAMGYARLLSGSLWPAVLLHAAFNTTAVLLAFAFGPEVDALTRNQNLLGCAATVLLAAIFARIASRSPLCAAARATDAAPQADLS